MSKPETKRRTQAERRAESRQAVLDSACRLFGEKGYADTSLDEIATDCGLTIRPIYHYFGNKKALFAAVNEAMEERIIDSFAAGEGLAGSDAMLARWRAYLDLCEDPAFRRIVLIDSPNILGRERWASSVVSRTARQMFLSSGSTDSRQQASMELLSRMIMGAFAEAALAVAEADDIDLAREQASLLVERLFSHITEEN